MKLEDLSIGDLKTLQNAATGLSGVDRERLRQRGAGQWSQVFHKPLPLDDDGTLPEDEGYQREYVRLDFEESQAS
ncbi:MAG TPA: hypothetical protein QGF58_26795 [Myxococcota bacterium]|nr:hypothetical protein [Myxococcota bacterium]